MKFFLIIFVSLLLIGCKNTSVYTIVDSEGIPINDVLIVTTETVMIRLFGKNKKRIYKTDNKGQINFYYNPNFSIEIGKKGFYPRDSFNTTSKTFKLTKTLCDCRVGYFDLECFESGTTIYEYVESPLWKDWENYLLELQAQGYYTNYKNYNF
jgi:hypothetical protein